MDNNKLDIFTRVTQTIVDHLEKGVRPWHQPWSANAAGTFITRPLRHNGEPYNGMNIILLWATAQDRGYQNPTFMTFKQAEEYKAHVRKGEKASLVVFANKLTKTEIDEKTGEDVEIQIPFMKGYSVFNVEQIEGLPEKFYKKTIVPQGEVEKIKRLESVEEFLKNLGADIRHGGNRAFYTPTDDFIQLPLIEAFEDKESYYATGLHEATHWTNHESRLNRDFGRIKWGDAGYAKEELVAEIGSAFLCADLGITPEIREDHAAYIQSWLKALKDDKKLIFSAAAHASRAAEFLKAKQPVPVNVIALGQQRPVEAVHLQQLNLSKV